MKKGSTRFSDAMRQTGGGRIGISQKPSKKVKTLRSVVGMEKLPKKILDDGHTVNLVTVPRKSRSVPSAVMNRRYSDPSSPNRTKAISRCEMPSTDGNKKVKLDPQQSIMKNEEEAIAGLLALAGNNNTQEIKLNNKISEATASKTEDLVQKHSQIHDLNESKNRLVVKKDSKDVTHAESRKRCSSHVYICQLIKNLKITKGKMVTSHKEAETKTVPENVMNVNVGINLNDAAPVSKTMFQHQPSGCGALSYYGNPYCDPTQWARPMFPKQQMWMNPFMYKPPQSGSYVQPSLHNVLGPKYHPSGYDENVAMFRVDSPPTLKLAFQ